MRIINKKYLLIILLVGIILTGVIIFKPKEEVKLNNVVLKQEVNNKTFAMYTETDNGYEEYNGNSFPKGQRLNKILSKCIDKNGEEIKDAINVDNKTGNINVKSNKSFSCYLYFDNKIEDLSGNGHNGTNHAQLWTEEGITTSIDESNLGYIDCGLANHDFKDGITIIVRARINQHTTNYNGRLISNGGSNNEFVINGERNVPGIVMFYGKWIGYTPEINENIYYVYSATYNGENTIFFINGKVIDKESHIATSTSSIYPFYLGNTPYFEGKTDVNVNTMSTFTDVLIFDSALSEEDIKENFSGEINKENVLNNYTNNGSDKKLLLYYKFN